MISKEMKRKIFELTLALYRVTDFFPAEEVLKKQLREKANEILGSISEISVSSESHNEVYRLLGKIKSIKSYLLIAKYQELVKPINISILEREYKLFEGFFERELNFLEEEAQEIFRKNSKVKKATAIERDVIFHQKVSLENNGNNGHNSHAENAVTNDSNQIEINGLANLSRPKRNKDLNVRQDKILDFLAQTNQVKIGDLTGILGSISSKTVQRDLNDLVLRRIIKKEGERRWTVYSLVS